MHCKELFSAFRSAVFTTSFLGFTALSCIVLIGAAYGPQRFIYPIVHFWENGVYWLERRLLNLNYRVKGLETLPPAPCIIAAKHQSAWETFKVNRIFHDPAIVLKQELTKIPIWGRFLSRTHTVPIDRSRGRVAIEIMLDAAQKAKSANRNILLFPQGTRTPQGVARPYRQGVARLYEHLNLPVVPVALNSGAFWRKGLFSKRGGIIDILILPAIHPGLTPEAMLTELEASIETAMESLYDE